MYNAGDIIIATNYIYYEQLHASYVSLPVLTTDNINLYKENTPFTIYPNPVNTYFKIINVDKIKAIELYDIIGNEYPIKLQEYVNISNLKSGIYIIKILTNENKIFLDKIIKL